MRINSAMPARQRIHPIVQDLLERLNQRFTPIKWLANNIVLSLFLLPSQSILCSCNQLWNYLAPTLCQLPRTSLEPLEKFQNRVMRFILGCPTSTRTVNMQTELKMPPLVDRIFTNVAYLSVKCLHSPYLAPHFSRTIQTSLDPYTRTPRLRLRPGGKNLVRAVCTTLQRNGINVHPAANVDLGMPPWQLPHPEVTFTPTSKKDPPLLQKQLALETIAEVSATVSSAACAVYSPTMEPPRGDEWVGRRLPNSSSSTYCELQGLLDAVTLLNHILVNGIVVCDSQALSSVCDHVVHKILYQISIAKDNNIIVCFLWIPSHTGLVPNDTVDRLAKNACCLDLPYMSATPSLRCYKKALYISTVTQA